MSKILAVPCEVYSRIVGYFRPVRGWNDGKRAEFSDRKMITVPRNDKELIKLEGGRDGNSQEED